MPLGLEALEENLSIVTHDKKMYRKESHVGLD